MRLIDFACLFKFTRLTEEMLMNNKERLEQTKMNLIEATIKLMEKKDNPLEVISREIAREAGCNPAMINYCFGSREHLIYAVFEKLYKDYQNSQEVATLIEEHLKPKDFLKKVYFQGAKFLTKNYNFAQALGGFMLLKRDLGDSLSYQYVHEHYKGTRSIEDCKLIAYELSVMMHLIVCRKEDFKNSFGIDVSNDDELKRIINMRVDLLLCDVD